MNIQANQLFTGVKIISSFILVFMLSACANGMKASISRSIISTDGSTRTDQITIEIPPAPSDEGGGTTNNRQIKDQNQNLNASDFYIDMSNSNIFFLPNQSPSIYVALTNNGIPKYTSIFEAVIENNKVYFKDPMEVERWADAYLDETNGLIVSLSISHRRTVGLNTRVYQFYVGSNALATAVDSEWVSSLTKTHSEIGGE